VDYVEITLQGMDPDRKLRVPQRVPLKRVEDVHEARKFGEIGLQGV